MAAVMCAAACCSVSNSIRHSRKVEPPGNNIGNSCIDALKLTNAAGQGLLFIGCVMSCQALHRARHDNTSHQTVTGLATDKLSLHDHFLVVQLGQLLKQYFVSNTKCSYCSNIISRLPTLATYATLYTRVLFLYHGTLRQRK